jgi:hypothetical protein
MIATPHYNGKRLPHNFGKAVAMLQRPYFAISVGEYTELLDLTSDPVTDFVLYEGKVCTFGDADGGFAIMPLRDDLQEEYR